MPLEIKKYKVKNKLSTNKYIKAGFRVRDDYYIIKQNLYDNLIVLTLLIDRTDNFIVIDVTDNNGETYGPFYNYELQHDNLVAEEVINNYHKFMDDLIVKGIMINEDD
jgi:hypothetical protein